MHVWYSSSSSNLAHSRICTVHIRLKCNFSVSVKVWHFAIADWHGIMALPIGIMALPIGIMALLIGITDVHCLIRSVFSIIT